MIVGGKYNWVSQPERLVYLGTGTGCSYGWHQFALVDKPHKVWCEVLAEDLSSIEESKEPSSPGLGDTSKGYSE